MAASAPPTGCHTPSLQLGRGLPGPGSCPTAQLSPTLRRGCSLHLVRAGGGGGSPEMPRIHSWLPLAVADGAWSPWLWPVTCSCFGDFRLPISSPLRAMEGPCLSQRCRGQTHSRGSDPRLGPRLPQDAQPPEPGAQHGAWCRVKVSTAQGWVISTLVCCCFAGPASPRWRSTLVPEPRALHDERAGIRAECGLPTLS